MAGVKIADALERERWRWVERAMDALRAMVCWAHEVGVCLCLDVGSCDGSWMLAQLWSALGRRP